MTQRRPAQRSEPAAERRKQQVLTQGTPAMVLSIADAVTIKHRGLFFLCQPDGGIPLRADHGLGLYYNDCRFLNGYELRLAGHELLALAHNTEAGHGMRLQLSNPEIETPGGLIPKEALGLRWNRAVDGEQLTFRDRLTFQNFGRLDVEAECTILLKAGFEDVFSVRELVDEHPGRLHAPAWRDGRLHFSYDGADEVTRALEVAFSTPVRKTAPAGAAFTIRVPASGTCEVSVEIRLIEQDRAKGRRPAPARPPRPSDTLGVQARVLSDSLLLNDIAAQAAKDLETLRSELDGESYFAAGVPWFATLFGRDSIITSLMTLGFGSGIAGPTLRLLARHQGRRNDPWRDEEPGKILHELRVGELARIGEIPHTPYFGTVDATPLFLVLLAEQARWTGSLALYEELSGAADAALEWIASAESAQEDGWLAYRGRGPKGLINQGWKDSGDAIVNADGSLAEPPIMLVEAQGYAYQAFLGMADLLRRSGDATRARELEERAARLKRRFDERFWLPELETFALALQQGGRPVAVVSSNPGHALWSGIVDDRRSAQVASRLMGEDMFSGWGVRTLSTRERRYNPIGYHLGTVWPHDNAILAAGFRRYGLHAEALRVIESLLEAASGFDDRQLPELFAGFSRADYSVPVRYPVACHPQAWAAASILFMTRTLLGLVPDGFERRLRVVAPMLPSFVDRLEVENLQVAGASVDLAFESSRDTGVTARVRRVSGDLDVVIEPDAAPVG